MQTFLPYDDFRKTAIVLDYRRLGKQRVEGKQILNCLMYRKNNDLYMFDKNGRKRRRGWLDHSAVKMWIGYEEALKEYVNVMITEWVKRGYNNTMDLYRVDTRKLKYPTWFGDQKFHSSHRANLLRKDFKYYSKYGWVESVDLPYVWPNR